MSDNKKYDLRERLLVFSKRVIEIAKKLPRTPEASVINKQFVAAGTSIGANYEEADGAVTKKDLIHKMTISRKEANETKYWLRIISDSFLNSDEVSSDIREIDEIKNILSAIINKLRK